MENKNIYIYISKIALEFRLSLENVCKLLGKSTDEKTKMEVYTTIVDLYRADEDMVSAYNYLFFYETLNEEKNMSLVAYTKAANFIKRYNKIKKEETKEEQLNILGELDKTDSDFKKIKDKYPDQDVTQEDIIIISKYRIKHKISRRQMAEILNVSRHVLENREGKIQEGYLKQKLQMLSEYFISYEANRRTKNK